MAEDGDYTAALRGSNSDQWQALKPPSAAPPRYGAAANPGGGASGGGACYRCGDPGHWSRDCPVPAPGNAGRMPPAGGNPGNPGNAVASKPCPCGAGMCAVRTSSTARNPGRQFLTCPAPQDAKCNFFEWCDAAGATPAKPSFQQQQQQNAGGEPELKCTKCTQPCPVFTAKTEKNAGRRFYKCRNEACNFFKWCDEALSSPGAGRGGYGNASSGYGVPGGPYGSSGNSFPAHGHGGSGVGFSSNPGGGYSGYTGSGYGSSNYEYRGNAPSGRSGYGGGGYGNA